MPELLVPIDEQEQPAQRIVDGIAGFPFDPEETRLTVLNVFEEFEVTSGEWSTIESDDFYNEEEFPENVARTAAKLSDFGYTVDVRREHGDPTEEIISLAHELDVDAIAIAGRQRSPVGKALLGSVTQEVILTADRPILVFPKDED
ncbi:universal stress protein [Halostella sp. JP-L12]|uniref:universal stress protein n=1 Tax=Halostella TaxID=1843185 RepID=UPI000EF7BDBF|nr:MULTISPECIES: universal stress protein [Halostella]NHN48030.1 universal stress protein [Halostella sp. JP-L12]